MKKLARHIAPPVGWERVPGLPDFIRELLVPPPKDGEKGDKGDRGEKGDKGDRGEKGDPGADGKDGANGAAGRDGAQGVAGRDGRDGKDGRAGKDGVDGRDGEQGVGIERVNFKGREMVVKLTDGKEFKHLLPSSRTTIVGGGGGADQITVGTVAPSNPQLNELWLDTN